MCAFNIYNAGMALGIRIETCFIIVCEFLNMHLLHVHKNKECFCRNQPLRLPHLHPHFLNDDCRFVLQLKICLWKNIIFTNDVKVFGIQVKTFPSGIGEAFDELIKKTGDAVTRSYYGISEFKDGKMIYYAAAEEKFNGEAEKYNYEKFTIEKGELFGKYY